MRHSQIRLHRGGRQPGALAARIYTVEPTGDLTYVHLRLGDQLLVASANADFRANAGRPDLDQFDQDHLHLFDATDRDGPALVDGSSAARPEPAVVAAPA